MQIIRYKSFKKGYLLGFFDIKVEKWGNFIINDIKLFFRDGKKSIAFPSLPFENESGEVKYHPVVTFEDKEIFSKFQEQVLNAIDEYAKLNAHKESEESIPF